MDQLNDPNMRKQSDGDQAVQDSFVYALVGILVCIFFVPAIGGLVLFGLYRLLKKEIIPYIGGFVGIGILLLVYQFGNLLAYFGLVSQLNLPLVSVGAERLLNDGQPIAITASTHYVLLGASLLFANGYVLFVRYFLKRPISSKAGKTKERQGEHTYQHYRKQRLKKISKKQMAYRKNRTGECFIGYSDFQERVTIEEKELNYHMLMTGGTGIGKTTLIAAIMESALQLPKPIIFVDGKGERASILEFKELCESYGRTVHIFSELDGNTYNPIKHGTITETRDKLMSLFQFSTEGDGAYYTDIASRYLQLIIKLLDQSGVPRSIEMIKQLTGIQARNEFFKAQAITKEIEETYEEEVEEPVETTEEEETPASSDTDDFDDFLPASGRTKQKPKEATVKKTVTRKRKRNVTSLEKGLQHIKEILDDEFPEDIVEKCLTRMKMQLGELLESDLGPLFTETDDAPGIDLRKISNSNDVVIFSISGNRYADYIKKLAKMVILDVNSLVAYRQEQGRKSIFAVYDEFSAYGDRRMVDIINKSRSAGFECIISTQTLSDIDAVDPVMTEQIINSCNTIATGRVNSPKDAERMAEIFGTYDDKEITQQIERKNRHLRLESDMGTVRDVERFRAHPNDIKGLQKGEIFLTRKMVETDEGLPYLKRVYVRNALDLEGIQADMQP